MSQARSTKSIAKQSGISDKIACSLERIDWQHMSSIVAKALALNLNSSLEWDTILCWLVYHEIKFPSRNIQKMLMDILEKDSQSASLKTTK